MRCLKMWTLAFLCTLTVTAIHAQGKSAKTEIPKGWQLLDREKDGYYGISLDTAYKFIKSKNLKSHTVIVGVIDSGIDTLHEDLVHELWTNPKEIPGNGIGMGIFGPADEVQENLHSGGISTGLALRHRRSSP